MFYVLQLKPGESRFVHFPVLPIVLGKVRITISGQCFLRRQTVTKTVTVRVCLYHFIFDSQLPTIAALQSLFLFSNIFIGPKKRKKKKYTMLTKEK